jgi:hypothetical protein
MTTKKFIATIIAANAVIVASSTAILAAICTALSFASFFGWTPWANDKIPSLTLLLLGLGLGPLVLAFSRLQQDQQALKQDLQRALAPIRQDQQALKQDLQRALAPLRVEQIRQLIVSSNVNANLRMVCDESLETWANNIEMAVSQQKVRIEERDFVHYYKETLRKYAGAEFYATSVCSEDHLWASTEIESTEIEKAIEEFTNGGGKMTRIFFMRERDVVNGNGILEKQLHMKVKVYTIDIREVRNQHLKLFLVDKDGRIAWDVTHSNQQLIGVGETFMTAKDSQTKEFLKAFGWLQERARVYQPVTGGHV